MNKSAFTKYTMMKTNYIEWNDNNVHLVLFYRPTHIVRSLKFLTQQSTCCSTRDTLSWFWDKWLLFLLFFVISVEAANIHLIVLDFTRPGPNPMIYRSQHGNHYTTDAITWYTVYISMICYDIIETIHQIYWKYNLGEF